MYGIVRISKNLNEKKNLTKNKHATKRCMLSESVCQYSIDLSIVGYGISAGNDYTHLHTQRQKYSSVQLLHTITR